MRIDLGHGAGRAVDWLRTLRGRLFALCALGVHLPLLTYSGWGVATGRVAWAEFLILTLASLAGTGVVFLGLEALLDLERPDWGTESPPTLTQMRDRLWRQVGRLLSPPQRHDENSILALEDPLTSIANRRGFLAQLDLLTPARRRGCFAIIDIDHFQQVNIALGHEAGDGILRDFATRLSAQTRRADIICRWDGAQFAIFYADAIEDEASWSLARIAERMRQEPVGELAGQPISFSAGLSRWRGGPMAAAIGKADEALRRAKKSGRDQVQRADHGMQPAFL